MQLPASITIPSTQHDHSARFADRREAGQQLSEGLTALRGQDDVTVVGIPRGGVIVAAEVARALRAPLEVWVAQKLRAPCNHQLAIGSLGEDGEMIVHEETLRALRIPATYLVDEVRMGRQEVARRAKLYRGDASAPYLRGRRVILVDDGLATGSTLQAALQGIKRQNPASIIVAVPVAPTHLTKELEALMPTFRTIAQPLGFGDIGQYYLHFREVTDAQVLESLSS